MIKAILENPKADSKYTFPPVFCILSGVNLANDLFL